MRACDLFGGVKIVEKIMAERGYIDEKNFEPLRDLTPKEKDYWQARMKGERAGFVSTNPEELPEEPNARKLRRYLIIQAYLEAREITG